MAAEQTVKVAGSVIEPLPNAMFAVKLEGGRQVRCHVSSQFRMRYVKLLPGDAVEVELSPYDNGRGRIIQKVG